MGILGSILSFGATYVMGVAEYNSAPPTITDGQQGPMQIDPNGNLKVNIAAGGSSGSQGAPAITANAWPIKVTDGTTVADVKAASTAAAFVDKAVAVDIRPGGVFPASAAPTATGNANSAVTKALSLLAGWNGATWDAAKMGLTTVQSTVTGLLNSIPMGIYNTVAPTPSNGNAVPFQSDASGNLKGVEQGGGAFPAAAAPTATANANSSVSKVLGLLAGWNGATWDAVKTGAVTVQTVVTGLLNTVPLGVYNTSAPSPSNGNAVPLQSDSAGNLKGAEQFAPAAEDNTNGVFATMTKPLASATYVASLDVNFGAAANAKKSIKGTAGNLFSIYGHNTNAAIRYVQIHNLAAAPAGGETPLLSFLCPATGVVYIDRALLSDAGIRCGTGIAIAFSTTEATYTAATAGESFWMVNYI